VTTTATVAVARPRRFSPAETSVLLLIAAGAWLGTIAVATAMEVMPGTVGLGLLGFLGAWTLMTAAMMLPSITPLASLYTRTMRRHRVRPHLAADGWLPVDLGPAGLVACSSLPAPSVSLTRAGLGAGRSPSPRVRPVASTRSQQ